MIINTEISTEEKIEALRKWATDYHIDRNDELESYQKREIITFLRERNTNKEYMDKNPNSLIYDYSRGANEACEVFLEYLYDWIIKE